VSAGGAEPTASAPPAEEAGDDDIDFVE